MRTIDELIDELRKYPGDYPIVLAGDAEGNSYEYLGDVYLGSYDPEERRVGEFQVTDEVDEEDVYDQKAVILYP